MQNGRKRKGEGGEMGCFIKGKIQYPHVKVSGLYI